VKLRKHISSAVAALALIGSASLAMPANAVPISASAKAALQSVAGAPTAEEKAVLALMEQVSPGSLQTLINAAKASPDTASLAATIESLTATNPSLLAVIENAVATFVADPRLAKVIAGTNCTPDATNTHSLVRIWCGLPALDPYPVVP
jgi:hypothetical protein